MALPCRQTCTHAFNQDGAGSAAQQRNRLKALPHGANLRRVLLNAGFSPHARITRRLNCGGRGLCATCGVWLETDALPPDYWHDQLAARFGYPRLSCQITVTGDRTIRLLRDKGSG